MYNRFSLLDKPERMDAELIRKSSVSEGTVALREASVRKILSGEDTFDEITRVIGEKRKWRGVRDEKRLLCPGP